MVRVLPILFSATLIFAAATAKGQDSPANDQVAAQPGNLLSEAENAFKFQDYARAEKILADLFYPELLLASPDDIIKAREYLGACHFWLGDFQGMTDEFTALLSLRPGHNLDPFYYPESLISKYQELREKLARLRVIDLDQPPPEPDKVHCERTEEVIIKRSWATNLIPFGGGQFINGQNTKGALFLTAGVLTLGMNVGAYVAAESLRSDNGFFTPENAEIASDLRIVQYVGLGTFIAFTVWGIVDAFMDFTPQTSSIKVVPCLPSSPVSGRGPLVNGAALCVSYR